MEDWIRIITVELTSVPISKSVFIPPSRAANQPPPGGPAPTNLYAAPPPAQSGTRAYGTTTGGGGYDSYSQQQPYNNTTSYNNPYNNYYTSNNDNNTYNNNNNTYYNNSTPGSNAYYYDGAPPPALPPKTKGAPSLRSASYPTFPGASGGPSGPAPPRPVKPTELQNYSAPQQSSSLSRRVAPLPPSGSEQNDMEIAEQTANRLREIALAEEQDRQRQQAPDQKRVTEHRLAELSSALLAFGAEEQNKPPPPPRKSQGQQKAPEAQTLMGIRKFESTETVSSQPLSPRSQQPVPKLSLAGVNPFSGQSTSPRSQGQSLSPRAQATSPRSHSTSVSPQATSPRGRSQSAAQPLSPRSQDQGTRTCKSCSTVARSANVKFCTQCGSSDFVSTGSAVVSTSSTTTLAPTPAGKPVVSSSSTTKKGGSYISTSSPSSASVTPKTGGSYISSSSATKAPTQTVSTSTSTPTTSNSLSSLQRKYSSPPAPTFSSSSTTTKPKEEPKPLKPATKTFSSPSVTSSSPSKSTYSAPTNPPTSSSSASSYTPSKLQTTPTFPSVTSPARSQTQPKLSVPSPSPASIPASSPSKPSGSSYTPAKPPAQQQQQQQQPFTTPGLCGKCGKQLAGSVIQAAGMEFHESCFGCWTCNKSLTTAGKCLNVGGKPYCEACGKQAFTGPPKKMSETNGMMGLMQWCQNRTQGYKDVSVTNWTKSWQDGLAFCALLHSYRPDLIPFNQLSKQNKDYNLKLAFDVATNKLRIEQLLDPEDFGLEKLSMMTYMSQVYKTLEPRK